MQVKIDTKDKFHVITPLEDVLSATMTDGINIALRPFLQNEVKNIVLNLENITKIDENAVAQLIQIQQEYYENSGSFVICCLQNDVQKFLSEGNFLELLNVTPTVSEGADIVQMEEVERELMGDFSDEEN